MIDLCQIRNDPELAKGAAKAVYELYDVVTHDLVSSDLRYIIWLHKCDFLTFFSLKFLYSHFNFSGRILILGTL